MRKHTPENEAMAAHLSEAHGVGQWALEPTIWGAKRDLRAMVKHHEKFHAQPRPWDAEHGHTNDESQGRN